MEKRKKIKKQLALLENLKAILLVIGILILVAMLAFSIMEIWELWENAGYYLAISFFVFWINVAAFWITKKVETKLR